MSAKSDMVLVAEPFKHAFGVDCEVTVAHIIGNCTTAIQEILKHLNPLHKGVEHLGFHENSGGLTMRKDKYRPLGQSFQE